MAKNMETTGIIREKVYILGYIGVISGLYSIGGYIRIMEKNMETTIVCVTGIYGGNVGVI